MRGMLKAYGITNRLVWAAALFAGLPSPRPQHGADIGDTHSLNTFLAVGLDQVQGNFRRDGLDGPVSFLRGWFAGTFFSRSYPCMA